MEKGQLKAMKKFESKKVILVLNQTAFEQAIQDRMIVPVIVCDLHAYVATTRRIVQLPAITRREMVGFRWQKVNYMIPRKWFQMLQPT